MKLKIKQTSKSEVEFYIDDEFIGYGTYQDNDRDKNYDWVEYIIEKIAKQLGAEVETENLI